MELKEDLQTYLGRAKRGLRAKIEYSIELCRKAAKIAPMYDDDGNLWLAFSGGKDSTIVLWLARKIYPDIKAVFCNTGNEIIIFINSHWTQNHNQCQLPTPKGAGLQRP